MRWQIHSGLAILAMSAVTLITTFGCGEARPDLAPVSGRVLIDGKPLTHGIVRFIPTASRISIGKLDSEGRYSLSCKKPGDGAVVGSHNVEIVTSEVLSATTMKWHAPKKYASSSTSELSFNVPEDGVTEANFDLSWNGGKPFIENLGAGSKSGGEVATGPFGVAAKK